MNVTATTPSVEERLTALLDAIREESRSSDHHYHLRRPWDCGDPTCGGRHPALALASACARTARQARALVVHVHTWQPFMDGSICTSCRQLRYQTTEEE